MTIEEARDRLKELREDRMSFLMGEEDHDEVFKTDVMAIDVAIRVLESDRGWIKCDEQLPEKNRIVICCCYGSDLIICKEGETVQKAIQRIKKDIVRVTTGFIGDNDIWCDSDGFPMMVSPSLWQSMPAPPLESPQTDKSCYEKENVNGQT